MAPPMSNPEPNFVMVAPDAATESVERLRRQALRLLSETREEDDAPSSGRDGLRRDPEPPAPRASSMIAGVLAMPAVFLAIVFVALALFGKPGEAEPAMADASETLSQPARSPAAGPTLAAAPSDARGVIALPDDARVAAIALDGDRIALHVEGPAGREIVVYDYREGRQIASAVIDTYSTEATDTLSMLTGPPPAVAAQPEPAAIAAPAPSPAFTGEPRLKPRSTP